MGAEAGQLFRTTVADAAALADFVRETDALENQAESQDQPK